jgi:hypothetical protein
MRTTLSKGDLKAIATEEGTKTGETRKEDSLSEQIVKNIPVEVVSFYITALGAAAAGKELINYDVVVWAIFGLGLVGTFVYMHKKAKEDLVNNRVTHNTGQRAFWKSAISAVAFVIWALYLGGPFVSITGYSIYGTLLILGYTFITPALYDAIPIPFPSLRGKKG